MPQARSGGAYRGLQQGCRAWNCLWRFWLPPYFATRGRFQLCLRSLAHFRRATSGWSAAVPPCYPEPQNQWLFMRHGSFDVPSANGLKPTDQPWHDEQWLHLNRKRTRDVSPAESNSRASQLIRSFSPCVTTVTHRDDGSSSPLSVTGVPPVVKFVLCLFLVSLLHSQLVVWLPVA